MSIGLALALVLSLGPPSEADAGQALPLTRLRPGTPKVEVRAGTEKLDQWLARPGPPSARLLEHGVIELGLAGGTPHLYRLDLSLGLFDVVSVGVTAHWLPGQAWPQTWPLAAIRVWHGRVWELGAHYRPVLFPPVDEALEFVPQAHFGLASFTLGAGYFSASLDAGGVHLRVPAADPTQPTEFRRRSSFGGGFVVRVGNEWIGLRADCLAAVLDEPLFVVEAKLDLRWDVRRPAGGWPLRRSRAALVQR